MKAVTFVLSLVLCLPAVQAQAPQEFTDPVLLLQAVAATYASGVDTFRLESISESTQSGELVHDWHKVYQTAIKGTGNLYRIETRSPYGSFIQLSDGVNEWVYLVEAKAYTKHPLALNWPSFPAVLSGGSMEVRNAWDMRTWLEAEAGGYKHATMLPPGTIVVEGRNFPCYVVHVTSEDRSRQDKDVHSESTFWIDKTALVFRKRVMRSDNYLLVTSTIHVPWHTDTVTVYPVADFNPQATPESFRFTPPADAKEVPTIEPNFGGVPPPNHPKAQMVGQTAPEVTFTAPDGKKIALSSYRGKPLLVDLWATWCGPCLLSMPALNHIYADVKDKGLAVIPVDQNEEAEDAAMYLARHHYGWTNYHDAAKEVQKAFKGEGIPLTVLIDAQGKIVYFDFGGNEAALRKAIAALGPEFASMAPAATASSSAASASDTHP